MLATVALSAAAVVVVGLLVWAFVRHDRADETERFHRAREITTSWAAPGPLIHDTVHGDQAAQTAAQPAAAPPVATQPAAAPPVATQPAAAPPVAPDDHPSADEDAVQVIRGASRGAVQSGASRDAVKRDAVKRGAGQRSAGQRSAGGDAAVGDEADPG